MAEQWQPIIIPGEPRISGEPAELLAELNGEAVAINQAREKFDAAEAEIQALTPAQLTVKAMDKARELPVRRVELLRRELALRERLASTWYPLRRQERTKAWEIAMADCERIAGEILDKLVSIGYIDGPLPGKEAPSITPDMIGRHPAMSAANEEASSARDHVHDDDDQRHNNKAMRQLNDDMSRAMKRALSAA